MTPGMRSRRLSCPAPSHLCYASLCRARSLRGCAMRFLLALFLVAGSTAFSQTQQSIPVAPSNQHLLAAPSSGSLSLNLSVAPRSFQTRAPMTLFAQNRTPFGSPQGAANPKAEPIPTQWPDAKLEPIPTQWPSARVELIGSGAAPAAHRPDPTTAPHPPR